MGFGHVFDNLTFKHMTEEKYSVLVCSDINERYDIE